MVPELGVWKFSLRWRCAPLPGHPGTVKVCVFPGEDALERLVSAILVEIEKWASDTKAYIKWKCQDA